MPIPNFQKLFSQIWSPQAVDVLLVPLGIAAGVSILLLLARRFLFRKIEVATNQNATILLVVSVFKSLSFFWCFIGGLYVGIAASRIPKFYAKPIYQCINALLVFSFTWALANFIATLFINRVQRRGDSSSASGLVLGVLKATIIIPGLLMTLSVLGISVTPVLTALGVGGIAVALALKDTLENFFAGIYLLFDKAIRVGDTIRLEAGQEGVVRDIGFRTTRLQLSSNSILIIPNSKLAQNLVANFNMPTENILLSIPFLVAYGNSIEKIEKAVLEIATKASEDVAGLQTFPNPSFRFDPGFTPYGLEVTLMVPVENYSSQAFVRHELRKRIYQKFLEQGVQFPKAPPS